MDIQEVWRVQGKKADFEELGKIFGITPITARVIRNRNHCTMEEYNEYLRGDIRNMNSPFLLKDMDKAVSIIYDAVVSEKRIRVIGDYDIDGVCSGYILTDLLKTIGANVDFDVPERVKDGYGVNERLIKQSFDDGVQMIITCDNGIAAEIPVEYAKSLGMEVIITDHHEVPFIDQGEKRSYILPKADAVVNPKQEDCGYPFKDLCGAGVALKLVIALLDYIKKQNDGKEGGRLKAEQGEERLKKYYVFAAIATVGDIVDLTGENRILVRYGLENIKKTDNYGLQALIAVNHLEEKEITSYHIGFILGPCINAGGRLETARLAFRLFMAETPAIAAELAAELKDINELRKNMTTEFTEKAVKLIEDSVELQEDRVLVLYLNQCHESLAGIIAGRLREKYNKPVFVLTDSADGVKGSGRSIEGYHMFDNLVMTNATVRCLSKFGGHSMAAGLSLPKENIELFRKTLNENCNLTEEMMARKVWIDVALPFEHISQRLIDELKLLEPFGKGNEKPVFADKIAAINRLQVRGKNKNVIMMNVTNTNGTPMEAVLFETEEEFRQGLLEKYTENQIDGLFQGYNNNVQLSVIYYPEINEYNGLKNIRVVIKRYLC
ncbi:MAG: single-stranded-DNA-specific exonuclease RecJ [Lachnospiraceae bacterium]|nr:single-stranded-DNA-specific exonuclease RecJ [Lachnospiraceae bacterium]